MFIIEEDVMEKILIFGCKNTMDDICIGCSRCLVGFNRSAGEFERYSETESELIGILGCGGCPGMGAIPRLANFGLWNSKLDEQPTKVHIAPCVTQHCPYSETIISKIKAKAGVEVIEGTHPFLPENIFA
jgi:predicted metal-binding protein